MSYQAIIPRGVEALVSALGPYTLLGILVHIIVLAFLVKSARAKTGYEVVKEEAAPAPLEYFSP